MTSTTAILQPLAVAGVLAMAFGCASSPKEIRLPPQTLTEGPTVTEEERAGRGERPLPPSTEEMPGAQPREEAPSVAGKDRRSVETVVIEGGESTEVTPRTLFEASRAERARRASSQQPIAVITNRNLEEYAEGGQLTVLGAPPADGGAEEGPRNSRDAAGEAEQPSAEAASPSTAGRASPDVLTEEFWRTQALKLRLGWKEAVEEITRLQEEVSDLRRRFYEEDDPFFRDNEIKPAWDRALQALEDARDRAVRLEHQLESFLEAGRRAGALPGWLREGLEYEPEPRREGTPQERRRSDDPREPKILDESAVEP